MSSERAAASPTEAEFLARVGKLRPELHRYCARLTGSSIDGEDVVQDALTKAFVAIGTLDALPSLRPWLFRIAHNRALDLIRSRSIRAVEPLEAAADTIDEQALDPLEALMRKEAINTAVSYFVELPTNQRSAVILKDVLGQSLEEIASLLDTSIDAVKGHLARGRAKLREINAREPSPVVERATSAAVARYVSLFNARDWDGLRSLLARDVKLHQSTHPVRHGADDVGMFFSIYARSEAVHLEPAWLDGREVIAVFEHGAGTPPSHVMWLDWRDGRISFIRDYRYVSYVIEGADLRLSLSASGV